MMKLFLYATYKHNYSNENFASQKYVKDKQSLPICDVGV